MNRQDRDALLWLGGLTLLGWLLSRKHGKCPRCNYPVTQSNTVCPNCGQSLDWRGFQ